MTTSVANLISIVVESFSVLMFAASFVVTEHAHSVFHCENLVVDSTVVSVLVSQVIEALSKLSDKLILFGGSNLDS